MTELLTYALLFTTGLFAVGWYTRGRRIRRHLAVRQGVPSLESIQGKFPLGEGRTPEILTTFRCEQCLSRFVSRGGYQIHRGGIHGDLTMDVKPIVESWGRWP